MIDHTHTWQARIGADDERAEDWWVAFGGLSVPIVSPIMDAVNVPERGPVAAFMLDLVQLDDGQRYRLAHHLGHRFGVPLRDVYATLETEGLPIVADGATISTTCCDYLPSDHVDRPHDPAFQDRLTAELAELDADPQRVVLDICKLDAFLLMGVLQIALKHSGVVGRPLAQAIDVVRMLQSATCPDGSARARIAICGWTGR